MFNYFFVFPFSDYFNISKISTFSLLLLQNSRRRPVRGLLHVSGDGLRVVDDETKGLIVDQTIEKVSFCAPDRNHERGFSYICRDGTTRRWMCHGFLACKDSGERLSHAVGCAFAVCLERKQRRDKECGVTMTFDMKNSTFTRTGSFRQQTLTERFVNNERGIDTPSAAVPPQPKPFNPFAIERPHATPSMLERQGSFRAFSTIGSQSPFKRQMSLRINDLPSNSERQKAFLAVTAGGPLTLATPNRGVSPIPELSPARLGELDAAAAAAHAATVDTVSQLCQELSQGLSLLTQTDILAAGDDLNFNNNLSINQNIIAADKQQHHKVISTPSPLSSNGGFGYSGAVITSTADTVSTTPTPPTAQVTPRVASITPPVASSAATPTVTTPTTPTVKAVVAVDSPTRPVEIVPPLPNADQWLGQVVKSTSPAVVKRTPHLASAGRAQTMSAATAVADPFDAEWAAGVTKPLSPELPTTKNLHNTNPFISPPKPPAQSFQVQL